MVRRIPPVIVVISVAVAIGCDALGPPPGTAAPRVLRVSPADGEKGVSEDKPIVVTFDRPMDDFQTPSAFQSSRIEAPGISWSGDFTVMTVIPRQPLEYAAGDGAGFPAVTHQVRITRVARDKRGVRLAEEWTSTFTTLRRATFTFHSDAVLDGYVRGGDLATDSCQEQTSDFNGLQFAACVGHSMDANSTYKGLLTFDIRDLPGSIVQIESALFGVFQYRVDGDPYGVLGVVNLEHVRYDNKKEAFGVGALAELGLLSNSEAPGWKSPESVELLTRAVRDDHAQREARKNRSQYRLVFSKIEPPGAAVGHVAKFYTRRIEQAAPDPLDPNRGARAPWLKVTALVP